MGGRSGVCVADYNNDGFDDIFITRFGQNSLYRNNGDGTFTDVTKAAGLLNGDTRWGAGCSFVDYDRDGHLDLFVSNYVRFSSSTCLCREKTAAACGKEFLSSADRAGYRPADIPFTRNNGDGTFTEVTERAGISKAPLTMA